MSDETKILTYSQQYDGDYLEAFHLSKDVTVTIASIEARNTVKAKNGKVIDKPIVHFVGAKRGLVLNKTNARTIAAQYGDAMANWIGKKITIYPDVCDAFGVKNTPCIRIRKGARFVPNVVLPEDGE
jgi:hypothetical protein